MPNIMDDVEYLSVEIGPRPAGTEEEQQAALYIADGLKTQAGMTTEIEDFSCIAQPDILTYCYFGLPFVFAVLALFLPVMMLPAFFVALICAGLYAAEIKGHPVLPKLFSRGVSQNVVARYSAGNDASSRHRKVIVVANYDSGKARSELSGAFMGIYGTLRKVCVIALGVLVVFLLFRAVFFGFATEGLATVLNFIQVVLLVLIFLPVIAAIIRQFASYNDAANSNAAGVAVLMELARRIGSGRISNEEYAARKAATVHDEEAARNAGVIPGDVPLTYEADSTEDQTEADRVAAAKASIAALTGAPIREYAPVTDIAANLAQVRAPRINRADEDQLQDMNRETAEAFGGADEYDSEGVVVDDAVISDEAAVGQQDLSEAAEQSAEGEAAVYEEPKKEAVPAWFTAAQEKAAKPADTEDAPVRRSRYADALDAAMAESNRIFEEANKVAETSMEAKLKALQQDIMDGTLSAPSKEADEVAAKESIQTEEAVVSPDETRPMAPIDVSGEVAAQSTQASVPSAVQPVAEHSEITQEPTTVLEAEHVNSTQDSVSVSPAKEEAAEAQPVRTAVAPKADAVEYAKDDAAAPQELNDAFEEEELLDYFDSEDQPEEESSFSSKAHGLESKVRGFFHRKNKNDSYDEDPEGEYRPRKRSSRQDAALGSTTALPPIEVPDLRAEAGTQNPQAEQQQVRRRTAGQRDGNRILVDEEPLNAELPVDADYSDEFVVPAREKQDHSNIPANHEPVVTEVERTVRPAMLDIPDIPADLPPVADLGKQRAPLAEAVEEPAQTREAILKSGNIPRIVIDENEDDNEPIMDNLTAARRGMMTSLPSMSGTITAQPSIDQEPKPKNDAVSLTGSFAAVGSTGSIKPIGDELVADMAPDDIYVEDVDDSAYDENTTVTGAFAGPGYMEMPKSRASRLFGRFGRKNKKKNVPAVSTNEWLDVDDTFEARKVGAERGGWESFKDEDSVEEVFEDDFVEGGGDYFADDDFIEGVDDFYDDDFAEGEDDGRWQGGAFSRLRSKAKRDDDYPSIEDDYEGDFEEEMYGSNPDDAYEPSQEADEQAPAERGRAREDRAVARKERAVRKERRSSERSQETEAKAVASEIRQIHGFRNPDINLDVWFVALGSQQANGGGIKAFLAEHEADMRGAIVINLDGLGAGTLSYIDEEGGLISRKQSSRMKRYVKKATAASGVSAQTAKLTWCESPAYTAAAAGVQSMSIVGLEGKKPAFFAQGDDTIDVVNPQTLDKNTNFLLELIKSI